MLLDKSYIKLFFISEGLCFPQEHGNVVNLEKSSHTESNFCTIQPISKPHRSNYILMNDFA